MLSKLDSHQNHRRRLLSRRLYRRPVETNLRRVVLQATELLIRFEIYDSPVLPFSKRQVNNTFNQPRALFAPGDWHLPSAAVVRRGLASPLENGVLQDRL